MMKGSGLHPIPKESKTKQSLILALVVHIALFVFLWIGINWQTKESGSIQAEVWDIKVSDAGPKIEGAASPIVEDVKPSPEITEPEPIEETVEAKTAVTEEKPDIALKQKKEEEEKRKEEARKKEEAKKKEKQKEEAKKKQLRLADQQKAAAIMAEEAKRLVAKGRTGGSGGSGVSAYSTGSVRADSAYIQKVSAKIKSNTIFSVPSNITGNPAVEYDVQLLPDGSIKGIRKRKSSGVPGFDEAVLRAIEKSAPFPANNIGKVPSRFEISHKLKG